MWCAFLKYQLVLFLLFQAICCVKLPYKSTNNSKWAHSYGRISVPLSNVERKLLNSMIIVSKGGGLKSSPSIWHDSTFRNLVYHNLYLPVITPIDSMFLQKIKGNQKLIGCQPPDPQRPYLVSMNCSHLYYDACIEKFHGVFSTNDNTDDHNDKVYEICSLSLFSSKSLRKNDTDSQFFILPSKYSQHLNQNAGMKNQDVQVNNQKVGVNLKRWEKDFTLLGRMLINNEPNPTQYLQELVKSVVKGDGSVKLVTQTIQKRYASGDSTLNWKDYLYGVQIVYAFSSGGVNNIADSQLGLRLGLGYLIDSLHFSYDPHTGIEYLAILPLEFFKTNCSQSFTSQLNTIFDQSSVDGTMKDRIIPVENLSCNAPIDVKFLINIEPPIIPTFKSLRAVGFVENQSYDAGYVIAAIELQYPSVFTINEILNNQYDIGTSILPPFYVLKSFFDPQKETVPTVSVFEMTWLDQNFIPQNRMDVLYTDLSSKQLSAPAYHRATGSVIGLKLSSSNPGYVSILTILESFTELCFKQEEKKNTSSLCFDIFYYYLRRIFPLKSIDFLTTKTSSFALADKMQDKCSKKITDECAYMPEGLKEFMEKIWGATVSSSSLRTSNTFGRSSTSTGTSFESRGDEASTSSAPTRIDHEPVVYVPPETEVRVGRKKNLQTSSQDPDSVPRQSFEENDTQPSSSSKKKTSAARAARTSGPKPNQLVRPRKPSPPKRRSGCSINPARLIEE